MEVSTQHELEKFLCVVESGGFVEAATVLHVSQPALSIAIKNLEKHLGVQLLLRSNIGNRLTPAGKVVYTNAKLVRLAHENLKSELVEALNRTQTLRVGMIDSIAEQLFGLKQSSLDSGAEITVDNSSRLIEGVLNSSLDLAITTAPLGKISARLKQVPLGDEVFTLVAKSDPGKSDLRVLDNYLAYDKNSNTARRIAETLRQKHIRARGVFHSTSPELLRKMAINGRGVALLPKSKVVKDIEAGRLVEIHKFNFARPICAILLNGKFISKGMAAIMNETKEALSWH